MKNDLDVLDRLMNPSEAFNHPSEVVHDPDLSLNEKRAILASWASDACAVEAAPDLRSPRRGALVKFDTIMDALRELDKEAGVVSRSRFFRRKRPFTPDRDRNDQGQALQ